MHEKWSKFHQRHGNTGAKPIYGSYVSDPTQFDMHSTDNPSSLQTIANCLLCFITLGGILRTQETRRQRELTHGDRIVWG